MSARKDAASVLLDFPVLVEAGEKIELAEEKKSNEVIVRLVFPPTLYEKTKAKCKTEEMNLNDCVTRLLTMYVDGIVSFS